MSRRKSIVADRIGDVPPIDGKPDGGVDVESASAADDDSSAGSLGGTTIDPASVNPDRGDIGNDSGTVKRKRGRPAGSSNAAKAIPADINGIEKLLYSIHSVAAVLIAPEMAMPGDECKELAGAISAVNKHYNIKLLDQKTADWIHLIQVVGVAYFGRVMAIRERKRMSAMPRVQPRAQSQNPVPGNPAPQPDTPVPGFIRPNGAAARHGEIPGLGIVEFPVGHELAPKGN